MIVTDIVAWRVKLPPSTLLPHTGFSSNFVAPLSVQVPANVQGKAAEDGQSLGFPDILVRKLEEASVFWLRPGSVLVIVESGEQTNW